MRMAKREGDFSLQEISSSNGGLEEIDGLSMLTPNVDLPCSNHSSTKPAVNRDALIRQSQALSWRCTELRDVRAKVSDAQTELNELSLKI